MLCHKLLLGWPLVKFEEVVFKRAELTEQVELHPYIWEIRNKREENEKEEKGEDDERGRRVREGPQWGISQWTGVWGGWTPWTLCMRAFSFITDDVKLLRRMIKNKTILSGCWNVFWGLFCQSLHSTLFP